MTQNQMVFTVPMPDSPVNGAGARGRKHWATVRRRKQDYWQRLLVMRMNGELPKRPRTPWTGVELRATLYPVRRMDDDNATIRLKDFCDWLVQQGYLVDDKRPHLRWGAIPEQESAPCVEMKGWCVVTLTKIQKAAA